MSPWDRWTEPFKAWSLAEASKAVQHFHTEWPLLLEWKSSFAAQRRVNEYAAYDVEMTRKFFEMFKAEGGDDIDC